MKKNTLKKVFSALSLTAVAASAVSFNTFAAGLTYSGTGDAAAATVTPTLTVTKTVVAKDMAGKDVTVNIDVAGANGKYCNTGIRLYYSNRLTIKEDGLGFKEIEDGPAVKRLGVKTNKIDESVSESGFNSWFFTTGGEGDFGMDGTMWSVTFTIPSDAQEGEVFPLDIVYQISDNAVDCFYDYGSTTEGWNMEAYLFTKGIYCNGNAGFAAEPDHIVACPALATIDKTYDGYIAIEGAAAPEETTTTTAATTTTEATTTVATANTTTTAAPGTTTTTPGSTTAKPGSTTKPGTTTKPGSTTKPGTTTTGKKDSSPKTGVAGVGVAAAGLAVAIGTAFVLRKKED